MNINKKILMIAPCPFFIRRGKSLRVNQHLKTLSDMGAEIDLLTYCDGNKVKYKNVNIIRSSKLFYKKNPSIPGFEIKDLFSNLHLILKSTISLIIHKYDAIHAHDVDGIIIGLISKKLTFKKIPLIYDMQGTFSELNTYFQIFSSKWLVKKIENYIHNNSNFIIMDWPHLKYLVQTKTKKEVVMNRPDPKTYNYLIQNKFNYKNKFSKLKYVLYTGNSADYQRLDLILDALQYLDKDIHLVFAGDISKKYKIKDKRIHYVGYVKGKRLVSLMKNANVLISTRVTKGFPPMKILFYLLTNIPIVATNASCHSSILEENKDAILCDPNPKKIAEGIIKAISNNNINKNNKWKKKLSTKLLKTELDKIYNIYFGNTKIY